ncbi:hypothetical protein B0H65DRAFT_285531 [Neurospora tetraspora]|uniref:Uncharacterized protein n=1 Tax=Neurospora tetraspora TaxID=94610 RepID=A0AAE0J8H2_9PEZI|nr:hypothetical protein B0H65DRAFT_285531 [Neurospora tetraspora]
MTNHLMIRYLLSCPVPLLCFPADRSINCRRLTVSRVSFHPTLRVSIKPPRGGQPNVEIATPEGLPVGHPLPRGPLQFPKARTRFLPMVVLCSSPLIFKAIQPAWRMADFLYGSLAEHLPQWTKTRQWAPCWQGKLCLKDNRKESTSRRRSGP